MSLRALVAVSPGWEAGFVAELESSPRVSVVRRCADLADLLAAAAAGLADVAIVSADLRQLDRAALHDLATHGVRVAGATSGDDEMGERRLRQLGLGTVLLATAPASEIEAALLAMPEVGAKQLDGVDRLNGVDRLHDVDRLDGVDRLEGARDPDGADPDSDPDPDPDSGPGLDPEDDAAPPARVIAVWGPTGAPGRTTLALNLAAELAAAGSSTLLIDADTYGASVAQALSLLDEAPGMAAAARAAEQGTLDLPSLARLAPTASPRLRVLTGIPRSERWPELRAAAVEHVLSLARGLVSHVVVDCGFAIEDDEVLSYDTLAPRRNATTLSVLAAADDLLVVGTADPVGLQRLVRAVQDVGSIPSPVPRVVVNRVRASAVGSKPERRIAEALARFSGLDVLTFLPFDLESLDGAMLAGRTLCEYAPQSELRRAIAAVAAQYLPPTRTGAGAAYGSRTSRRLR